MNGPGKVEGAVVCSGQALAGGESSWNILAIKDMVLDK